RFNATRYPLAFYLGSENYVKTVVTSGDGKAAITKYSGGRHACRFGYGTFSFLLWVRSIRSTRPGRPVIAGPGNALPGIRAGASRRLHAAIYQSNHPAIRAGTVCFSARGPASSRRHRVGRKFLESIRSFHQGD